MSERGIVLRSFSVVSVSLYLIVVGTYLILSKRIHPPVRLRRLVKALWTPFYSGILTEISPENGHCFLSPIPPHVISDKEGYSKVVVYEDGVPLRSGHVSHEEIRKKGMGTFSHWGTDVYFSSSDNSDPSTNGRTYSVREVKG